MTQLVFVHGVATREGADYETTVSNRTRLFKSAVFSNKHVNVYNPYWGNESPIIDPHVYETGDAENSFSLNIDGGVLGLGHEEFSSTGELSITTVGKENATIALDAIFTAVLDAADQGARPLSDDEVAAFTKAVEMIDSETAHLVFNDVQSDEDVAGRLQDEDEPEAFGIINKIGKAVTAATDRVRNAASSTGSKILKSYSPKVGVFLGDVFVYLKAGRSRDSIRRIVLRDLNAAYEASQKDGGPIVLVGHSLGGVILTDILMDTASAGLPSDFKVSALFTVGSQPGFFAGLDLLARNTASPAKRRRPECVGAWYNIFDPIDPFAFRADGAFENVSDVEFDSVTGLMDAHSAYFQRPQFYARFRSRLQEQGVLPKK